MHRVIIRAHQTGGTIVELDGKPISVLGFEVQYIRPRAPVVTLILAASEIDYEQHTDEPPTQKRVGAYDANAPIDDSEAREAGAGA